MGDYTSIKGTAKVKNASEPAAFIVTFSNPRKFFYSMILCVIICSCSSSW